MNFFNKIQKNKTKEYQNVLAKVIDEIQAVITRYNLNTYEVMDMMQALQAGFNMDTATKLKALADQNKAMRQTLIDNGLLKSQEGVDHT